MYDCRIHFLLRSRMFSCKMNFLNDPKFKADMWRCDLCENASIASRTFFTARRTYSCGRGNPSHLIKTLLTISRRCWELEQNWTLTSDLCLVCVTAMASLPWLTCLGRRYAGWNNKYFVQVVWDGSLEPVRFTFCLNLCILSQSASINK